MSFKEVSEREFVNFLNSYPEDKSIDSEYYDDTHFYCDYDRVVSGDWPDSVVAMEVSKRNEPKKYLIRKEEE